MEKPQFVYVSYLNTSAEKLWEALTKTEFTRQYWFDSSIESDWKVGSPVIFRRGGKVTDEQVLLKCEPPRLLSYTWHPVANEEYRNEKPSRVTFEIEPFGTVPGKAVKLTVTHDDFPETSKVFQGITMGWPVVLSSLKSLLETGVAMEMGPSTCSGKTNA